MDYRPHTPPYLDGDGNLRIRRRHSVEHEMCLADDFPAMTLEQVEAHHQAVAAVVAADVLASGVIQPTPELTNPYIGYWGGSSGGLSAWLCYPLYEVVEAWPPPADPEPEPEV